MSTGEVIQLEPPLPGLARSVRIEFRSGGMGKLARSHPATRVEATHAEIVTVGPTGKDTKEDVEVAFVDEYLRSVEEFRRRIFEKQQEHEVEKEVRQEHLDELADLLARAGVTDVDPSAFRRYGSARALYNFDVDNAGAY